MTKTLFIGSNWEALVTLKALVDDDRFQVVGLITQPDKPVGRKQEILPSEIKKYAIESGIEVYHTEKKKDRYKEALKLFKPELIVCKSFGEILPGFFIDYPKYKTINVHYSLLPKYRGAVPIQKAILEGDNVTGITYVQMVEKMDAGPILKLIEEKIREDDTNQTLRERLVAVTTETIGDLLQSWVEGEIETTPQDESKATYCWQNDISKENAYLDWSQEDPIKIDRKVRAFLPWPVAWTYLNKKRLKIYELETIENGQKLSPGEYSIVDGKLLVGTSNPQKAFLLKDIQLEGKQRMKGEDLARGLRLG